MKSMRNWSQKRKVANCCAGVKADRFVSFAPEQQPESLKLSRLHQTWFWRFGYQRSNPFLQIKPVKSTKSKIMFVCKKAILNKEKLQI